MTPFYTDPINSLLHEVHTPDSTIIDEIQSKPIPQPERGTLRKFHTPNQLISTVKPTITTTSIDDKVTAINVPEQHTTSTDTSPVQRTSSIARQSTATTAPDMSSPISVRLTKRRQCISPCITCHSGHYSMQGIRNEMEDRVTMLTHPQFNELLATHIHADVATKHIIDLTQRSYYGIFDGHGGDVSAEYGHQHVHMNMLNDSNYPFDSCAALKYGLLKTDNDFCNACRRINLLTSSGTTALTVYIECDVLIVGNIGDSRGVLCRNGRAVPVSNDHKPGRPDEQQRIEKLGGKVGTSEDDVYNKIQGEPTQHNVFCSCLTKFTDAKKPLRLFPGGLSVSRTIGDISMKATRIVSNEPEMYITHLAPQDTFLILACDGVWDVLSNEYAVQYVSKHLKTFNDCDTAAKNLAKEAYRKGSTDNITVVVVMFQHHTPIQQTSERFTSSHCDIVG